MTRTHFEEEAIAMQISAKEFDRLQCPCCGVRFDTPARPWQSLFTTIVHHFSGCPAARTLSTELRRATAADLATRSLLDDTDARRRRLAHAE